MNLHQQHNRKEENIALLEYLLTEFRNNPDLDDIRLGQLIVNSINPTYLFMIESDELKENIESFLKL